MTTGERFVFNSVVSTGEAVCKSMEAAASGKKEQDVYRYPGRPDFP